jgi:hypothetical protein
MFETPMMFFGVSLFMILDLEAFNRVFDLVNLFYLLLVVAIFAFHAKRQEWKQEEAALKIYEYKKRDLRSLKWQDRLAGSWKKFDRKNFYEVSSPPVFPSSRFFSFSLLF